MKTDTSKSRWSALRRAAALSACLAASGVAASGCHILIDHSTSQCRTNDDCTARGGAFVGSVCNTTTMLCERPHCTSNEQCTADHGGQPYACEAATGACVAACSSNQQCVTAIGGQPAICRHSDSVCVPILSDDCPRVHASASDIANDNTIWVPLFMPFMDSFVPTWENTLEIARNEFKQLGSDLPAASPGQPRRPLAFVICNHDTVEAALRAANHMNDLGMPAMLGPGYSGITVQVANMVAIPNHMMILSYYATSPLITSIASENPRLIWRTIPSDASQGLLQAYLVEHEAEPRVRHTYFADSTTQQLRVAIVHKGDAYGLGLSGVVRANVHWNGGRSVSDNGSNFRDFNYGDPAEGPIDAQLAQVASGLVAFQPDVIVSDMVDEGIMNVFSGVEAQWPTAGTPPHRPFWVMSEAAQSNVLLGQIDSISDAARRDDLRRRIIGSAPGPQSNDPHLVEFLGKYRSQIQDATTPVAYDAALYDAVYLLAYAIVANGSQPLTGENLATAMGRLVPDSGRPMLQVGPESMFQAFDLLGQGRGFDFNGAYGPQDFDLHTGEAQAQTQVWCVRPSSTASSTEFVPSSGQYLDPTTGNVTGTIDSTSCALIAR